MGGLGSGNHWQTGRTTTDALRRLDLRKMAREGALRPGAAGSWVWSRDGVETGRIDYRAEADHLRLIYKHRTNGGPWGNADYRVRLERTPCHLGGSRIWGRCPALGCGRRIAVLYGGAIFACRQCHNLVYRSQRQSDGDRASDKAWAIRERLGWPGGLLDGGDWGRPKGMHRKTYARLCAEYDRLEMRALADMVKHLPALEEMQRRLNETR